MLGDLNIVVSSDLSGVKIDAKNGDILCNFKVFVLGVGCWLGEVKCLSYASI